MPEEEERSYNQRLSIHLFRAFAASVQVLGRRRLRGRVGFCVRAADKQLVSSSFVLCYPPSIIPFPSFGMTVSLCLYLSLSPCRSSSRSNLVAGRIFPTAADKLFLSFVVVDDVVMFVA